jgi:hypothetical protein
MSEATGIAIRCILKNPPLKEHKDPKFCPIDMSTWGAEQRRDIILWRRRTFIWQAATAALAIALCLVAIFR